jgi:hypothetical protein
MSLGRRNPRSLSPLVQPSAAEVPRCVSGRGKANVTVQETDALISGQLIDLIRRSMGKVVSRLRQPLERRHVIDGRLAGQRYCKQGESEDEIPVGVVIIAH